jgi:hypothetical protein
VSCIYATSSPYSALIIDAFVCLALDDYIHVLRTYLKRLPAVLLSSPSLPVAFDLTLVSLTLPAPEIVMNALETIVRLLEPGSQEGSPYQATITAAAKTYGHKIITIAINGMVQEYVEQSQDAIIDILKELIKLCPAEVRAWTLEAVQGLPGHVAPVADKQEFHNNLEKYVSVMEFFLQSYPDSSLPFCRVFAETNLDLIKPAIRIFFRSTRRARDRKERLRSSLGNGGDH